ncbi:MAG: cupredoxin domain-containing protein [Burkholderiales bacterium]|nr:cupredoxin domain-containing protein [Burkholderiales bacterium]
MSLKKFILGAALTLSCLVPALAEELLTFQITAKNGKLIPERIEVPAGRKIKLVLKNEGLGPEEFENLEMRVEKVLGPGATSFVVLHNLKPGTYRFVDEFHPETAQCLIVAK